MSDVSELRAAEPQVPAPPKPWGYLSTFGWAVLVNIVGSMFAIAALHLWNPAAAPTDLAEAMKDAQVVSITTIVANVVQIGLLVWAVRMVRWKAKDYLALIWPSRQEVGIAVASLVVLLPMLDGMAYLSGREIIPPFMTDLYHSARSTGSLPLLWLSIVVAAPVAEEIIFRGFLFRGWVRSARSAIPGILIVSAVFAVIHIQYNWFGVLQVFMIGLLLTWTRWRSGSTLLPMLMHVIANGYAMLQTIVLMHWLS